MTLSYSEFSRQSAYIAKNCADWAGDCLLFTEKLSDPMTDTAIARFLMEVRGKCDLIEEMHKEGKQRAQDAKEKPI